MTRRTNIARVAYSCGILLLLAVGARGQTTNYALGKTSSASGNYTGSGYCQVCANDGDINTSWNGGSSTAWWQVDLGTSISIDNIVLRGDGSDSFSLTGSNDGTTWFPIGGTGTTPGGSLWSRTIQGGAVSARYVRYTTLAGSYDWANLRELQVFGAPSGIPATPAPSTWWLALLGLAAVALTRLKWQRSARSSS